MLQLMVDVLQKIMPALLLNRKNVSPLDLGQYKIVVTSYRYVSAEYERVAKFKKQMEDYRTEKSDVVPKRPHLTLTSGVWEM